MVCVAVDPWDCRRSGTWDDVCCVPPVDDPDHRNVCFYDVQGRVNQMPEELRSVAARLVSAIILQAMKDWAALDYGRIKVIKTNSHKIRSDEVYAFFTSPECEAMVRFVCPSVSAEEVRTTLLYGSSHGDFI